MAASSKSEILGLSLWAGTDKPRRADFVADNTALETIVGGHISSTALHLDDAMRTRITAPFEVKTYTGTGAESRAIITSFAASAVVVFAVGKGPSVYNGTCTKHYTGFSASGNHSMGVSVTSIQVRVYQTQTAPGAGGEMAALNESGVTYVVLAFR